MKKVLIAFDGTNFSAGAFDFVRRLNTLEPIMLTGAFMPSVHYTNIWNYGAAVGTAAVFIPDVLNDDPDLTSENIGRFKLLCEKNSIKYRVHEDFYDFTLPELKKESRFADLLVLSGQAFFKGLEEHEQFDYLRQAVHASECPVVIVPENFEFPDNNVLAYDGSDESVYALKQFAYLFPEFTNNRTLLVYAEEEMQRTIPSKDLIIELATQHFSDLELYKLELDPKRYFNIWMRGRMGAILVTGSFSRSAISQLFRKSFVADILRDHRVPVFIAHR